MKKKYVCINIETNEIFTSFPHELTQELKDIIKSDREYNQRILDTQNKKIELLEARLATSQENIVKLTILLSKIS